MVFKAFVLFMSLDAFHAREPYFAVLTAPRFLRANLTPEHEREFFASGEDLIDWMFGVIDAGLSPKFAAMSTLEYGCGIGRLALPLARRPGSVTAVDSSPAMLEHAKAEAEQRGLGHIVFETPEALFARPRKFDLVVCYHVLQRMAPADGVVLLRRLIDLIAPSGIGMFQWPDETGESGWVGASRWIREHVPGANAAANRLRGKAGADPFIPTHCYPLDEMLPAFDAAGFRSTHVVFEHQQSLGYAIVLAQRPEISTGGGRASAVHPRPDPLLWKSQGSGLFGESQPRPPRPSTAPTRTQAATRGSGLALAEQPRPLIDYNRSAEQYYASLTGWEHHLAKPFSQIEETPAILMNVAVLLQSLELTPGLRVLEFGAGTGWLARFLTQLGCQVTLLDVSPTALQIAREHFRRQPVSGQQPDPVFLEFDGRRIDVADGSIDRVICFDAFHHAPNPDDVIREFARVLADGGIAAFAEPGPRHSESARSQFESQTYGVVERDVDVHAIWRTAQAAGFSDIRMCVFHEPPFHVSLEEYADLIAGGVTEARWLASTRGFLHHVRNFVLVKSGDGRADSRRARGLLCDIRSSSSRVHVRAGQPFVIEATVINAGTAAWLAPDALVGGVTIGAHLYDATGQLVQFEIARGPLTDPPRLIAAGETVASRLTISGVEPGRYRLELDCVADRVTWFAQAGSKPAAIEIASEPE